MNKLKNHISLIIAMAIIVAIVGLSLVGVCLIQKEAFSVNSLFDVHVEAQGTKEKVICWSKDNNLYVFLPSFTEYITLVASEDCVAEIEGLSVGVRYSMDEISCEKPYSFFVKNSGREQTGNIVFMQSQTVPSLFINTDSGAMDYIHAVKGNAENAFCTLIDETQISQNKKIILQGRGNTSWSGCEKKGYKITFEETQSLLGLNTANTYLLIANARSNYLSNTVAFWLSEQMGIKYVPECRHIDLYLNGEYVGNYILCEQISVNANSIDITDLQTQNIKRNPSQKIEDLVKYTAADGMSKGVLWANEPDDISGGYFLERDVPEYYKDEISGFVLSSKDHFVIKGPKYASQQEVEYIRKYMQETYDALSSTDGYHAKTQKYYGEYLDIDSFALKYVLEEFLNFNDAGRSSAYYYKEANGKLYAGPGWDFEGAFINDPNQITKLNATYYSTDWYKLLLEHDDFKQKVKQVYEELLLPALDGLQKSEFSRLKELNKASVRMDSVRWEREDFEQSCNKISIWIEKRVSFLNEQWLSENKYVTVTVKAGWQNDTYFYLLPGQMLSEEDVLSKIAVEGAAVGGLINKETGMPFEFSQAIEEDIVLEVTQVKTKTSLLEVLLPKISQVLPEVLFVLLFIIVMLVYIAKFLLRRKRR